MHLTSWDPEISLNNIFLKMIMAGLLLRNRAAKTNKLRRSRSAESQGNRSIADVSRERMGASEAPPSPQKLVSSRTQSLQCVCVCFWALVYEPGRMKLGYVSKWLDGFH